MVGRKMRVLVCHPAFAFDSGIVLMRSVRMVAGGQLASLFKPPIRRRMRCRQTGARQRQQRGHQHTGEHGDQA